MANNKLTSFIPDSAIDEYLATGSAPDEYLPYLQAAMPLQSPEPVKQPEQDSRPSGITGAFGSGVKQTGGLLGSAWDTITNDQEELRRDALAPAEKTAEQEAFEQAMQRNLDASPSNSFWQDAKDVGSAIWDQPMGAFHTMIGQLPNSAVVLGGMWAGAKTGAATGAAIGSAAGGVGAAPGAAVGAIVGGITGMYAGNAAIETGAIAQDAMREGEFDRGEVLQQAATKAGVITGIDTATMGVGKLILGAPSRAATAAVTERLARAGIDASDNLAVARAFTDTALAREVLDAGEQAYRAAAPGFGRYAAQGALETTAEGTGEYLGSLTAGLEATFADAILESVMSAPQSAVDVAISSSMADNNIANRQLSQPEQLANAALTARENAAAGGADALGQAQAAADTLSNWTPTSAADELMAGDFPASRREMRGIQREVGTPDLPPIEVAPDGTALVGGMSDQERMFYERSKQQQKDAVGLLARGEGVQLGKTKMPEQPMPTQQPVEFPLTQQQPPIQNQPGVTMTAPKPDLILRANGEPFKTERSAKLSAKFKSNPGATVAPIEGGFAIQLPVQPITSQEVDQQPGVAAPQAAPAVEAPVVESVPSVPAVETAASLGAGKPDTTFGTGKRVGSKVYLHKQYADEIPGMAEAKAKLPEDFTYNAVRYDTKSGEIQFAEAPDFDTAAEPTVGKTFTVKADGSTKTGQSSNVWHHKWQWVQPDYQGFNYDESVQRSIDWQQYANENGIKRNGIGSAKSWAAISEKIPAAKQPTPAVDRPDTTADDLVTRVKANAAGFRGMWDDKSLQPLAVDYVEAWTSSGKPLTVEQKQALLDKYDLPARAMDMLNQLDTNNGFGSELLKTKDGKAVKAKASAPQKQEADTPLAAANRVLSPSKPDVLTPAKAPTKGAQNVIDAIEKTFGVKVVPFSSREPALREVNGFYTDQSPGHVFVRANDADRAFMAVVGHEMTHELKRTNPEAYNKLMEVAREEMKNTDRFKQMMKAREDAGITTDSDWEAELLSDFVGDQFTKPSFWKQVADRSGQSKVMELWRAIDKYITSLKNKLRGYESSQFFKDVDKMERAVVEAFSEFTGKSNPAEYIAPQENSQYTQRSNTKGTYQNKLVPLLKDAPAGRVLDYGAGMGHGIDIMADGLPQMEVVGYEPNYRQDVWLSRNPPAFTDNTEITGKFDVITNMNVLNVLPKELRDKVVMDMVSKLNPGGRVVIGVRGSIPAKDTKPVTDYGFKPEPGAMMVRQNVKGDVYAYQKGFKGAELKDYIQKLVGPEYDVKSVKAADVGVEIVHKGVAHLNADGMVDYSTNKKPSAVRMTDGTTWYRTRNGEYAESRNPAKDDDNYYSIEDLLLDDPAAVEIDARGNEIGPVIPQDGVAFSKRQGGSKKSRAALIKKHGANYVNGDIELVDPVIRDAAKAYLGRLSEAESKRINDNLIKFRGTPWGNAAIKGLATREAWHRAENGQDFSDIDNSEVWGKDAGGIARSHFTKAIQKGEQAIIDAMMSYKVLRDNRKAEKHVSTSFKNCDPSLACAKHCYSAGGQGGGPAAVRQAEFMELLAERFPDRFAKKIASQYRASALGEAGLALRINDKGDLSEAQLDVLKRLNDDGIRLQVFSKRPELLRKLDPMNLRMLSVDDTNFQLALDNPDLQLAVTITDGMTEEQVSQVADRVAVYLPVNLKSTAWTHKQIKDKFPGVFDKMKKKLCPVESNKGVITKPGTSFVHIVNKETDNAQGMIWTCTYCDLKGAAGCFNGDNQTKLAMKVRQQNLLASSDVATQEFIRAYNQTKAGLDAMVSMGVMTNAERDEILSRVNRGTGSVRQDAEAGTAREGGTQYSPRNSRDERGGNSTARESGNDAGRGLGGLNAPSGQSQPAGVDQATRRLETALGRSAGRNLPAGTVTRAVLDAASQGQKWAAEFAQEAARLFQKTAVFVDINDAELDGSFDGAALRGDPNTLYINSSATTPYHVVMGHELTHLLKQDHADLYQQLEDLIIPQATRREDSAKFHGYDVNSAKGREEYVADVVGNRFGEKAFWEAMAQHNPTGFRKIARIARSIIEKLVNTFRHKKTKYGDSVRELNRLRSDIAKVMSQYQSRQNPTAKVSAENEPMFQAAWHGTPHSWEHNKASLDAIGTGEGAQAYGWGLYFAGKRSVAEWYRDKLSKQGSTRVSLNGEEITPQQDDTLYTMIFETLNWGKPAMAEMVQDLDPSDEFYRAWQKVKDADLAQINEGNLYQVDIPEDSELLDWDKTLDQQKHITDLIRREISNVEVPEWVSDQYMVDTVGEYITEGGDVVNGADLYRMLKYLFVENTELQLKVASAIGMDETSAEFGALPDDQAVSLYLNSLGIPGLRYLDGTSRNDRDDASHNYVIWDEDLVTVEAVNDELVQAEQQAADEGVDFSRRQRTGEAFSDLTQKQRSALAKIGPPTIKQKLKERIDKLMNRIGLKLRQGMVDRFASLRELDEQARGKNVVREDTANSSWVLSRMSASADGALNSLMNFGRIKMNDGAIDVDTNEPGLIEVLKRLGDSHEIERFMGWIAGNRSDKLFDEGRENLFVTIDEEGNQDRSEIDALMTLNQGNLKDGRSREAVYDEVFADFQKARDDVLAIADQAGLLRKGLEEEEALLVMASTHKMGQDIAKKIRRLDRQYMQAEDAEEQLEIGQKQGRLYQELQELLSESLNDFDGELEVLTTDQRELWANEFYVPFYRIMEEDQSDRGPRNTSGLSRQETYKRLKGGKQDLGDLLENTLLNFHHLLSASLKNKAAQVALDNAEAMNVAEVTTAADRRDNASTFVLRDGMKVWYNISDPLVYEALTSLTDIGMNSAAMRVMRAFKRVFTEFTTASPQFMAANLIRDSFQAVALADMDRNPIANAVKGINAYGMFDKNKELRARMLASGGAFAFGHQFGEDADAIKSAIDREMRNGKIISTPNDVWQAMRAGWDYYRGLSDSLENANRAAIFKKASEGGENFLLSAFESRDLMDFSAHGAWPAIRFLTGVVPFLNARIQGLDKIYRSGVKPGYNVMRELFPGADPASDTDRKAAARFWAVTGALTAATMALYLVNYDDEDYRELEDWQKDAYWAFKAGDAMFFIPKPFEVGAIATLAERGLEQMVDDKATGKLFAERLGHMMMDTFSFDPTPQMLSPLVDIYANKDSFSGRPIESVGMERLSPSQRSRANTTEFAKGLSAFTESTFGEVLGKDSKFVLSPVQIDYLIGGYLGWLGERAIGMTDVMAKTAMGKTDPAKAWYEYQPMRRFYKDLDLPGYSKYQTRFYEDLREVNRVYADIQHYRKLGQVEEAVKLAKEKRNLLAQRKALNGVQRQLGTINQRMKLVRNSNKSPEEKRAELDRLQAIKNRMTKLVAERISRE